MKQNRFRIIAVTVALLAFGGISPAVADTDPFPGVAQGAEIPGTRVSGDVAIDCPAGSGRGIEANASTGGTASYCVKTWQSQSTIDAWAAYRSAVDAAQAAALAQSQAWNEANPGKQKCFQWGPFTDPSGGTSSGGVCANPVSAPAGVVVETPTVSSPPVVESSTPVVASLSAPAVESTTPVVASSPAPVAAPISTPISDTQTVLSQAMPATPIDSLQVVEPEVEMSNTVDAAVVGGKTRIEVATEWITTKLSVVATKKGSKKKYTYKITTDDEGNFVFKSSLNLKGFTVVLYKGSEELDRTVV